MTSKKTTLVLLGAWLAVALSLLLLPISWGLRVFDRFISRFCNGVDIDVQPFVHFFLMFLFAFLLMRLFSGKAPVTAVLYAAGIAAGFSVGVELVQGHLPEEFYRKCDLYDLIPSFAGAACGSIAGLVWCKRSKSP